MSLFLWLVKAPVLIAGIRCYLACWHFININSSCRCNQGSRSLTTTNSVNSGPTVNIRGRWSLVGGQNGGGCNRQPPPPPLWQRMLTHAHAPCCALLCWREFSGQEHESKLENLTQIDWKAQVFRSICICGGRVVRPLPFRVLRCPRPVRGSSIRRGNPPAYALCATARHRNALFLATCAVNWPQARTF